MINLLQSAPITQALSSGVTQVVELDGVIGELAKRHFGFVENDRMKVLYILPPYFLVRGVDIILYVMILA